MWVMVVVVGAGVGGVGVGVGDGRRRGIYGMAGDMVVGCVARRECVCVAGASVRLFECGMRL